MSLNRALLVAVIILTPLVTLTQPLTAHAQVILTEKLRSLDNDGNDNFGTSIAVNGNIALIGASFASRPRESRTGAAYLFDVVTGIQGPKLEANEGNMFDYFGNAVALSGNRALVGASDASGPGLPDQGFAYLFDATTGKRLSRLEANDPSEFDYLGSAVDLLGNTALIGAIGSDEKGVDSGAAYLFDAANGEQRFKLTADDGTAGDNFGSAVAISGNTAFIGAERGDGGAVYLFDIDTGNQQNKLTASDRENGDFFGSSVALSGNLALIGAPGDDFIVNGFPAGNVGSAYLFDMTTGRQIKLTASDGRGGDNFGFSVALSGNFALIGCPYHDNSDKGAAYLFDITTGSQVEKIVAGDGRVNDFFGEAVALSGDKVFVGSRIRDGGSVYVSQGSAAPEPGTIALLALALPIGIGIIRRRSAS